MNDIKFPTISVGGRDLVVRISIAAQLLMSRRGIDIYKLSDALARRIIDPENSAPVGKNDKGEPLFSFIPNPRYPDNLMFVFAAAVAENFVDQTNPDKVDLNKAPTADYWATQLHPLQFAEVQDKIEEALGKVSEARQAGLRVVAPPAPAEQAS
jgi:hypothetical protein